MSGVIIVGAGIHGRTVAHHCRLIDQDVAGFLDDALAAGEQADGIPVLGGLDLIDDAATGSDALYHVALEDGEIRLAVQDRLAKSHRPLLTVIHPVAEIYTPSEIGEGAFVGAFALVCINAWVAAQVTIGSNCSIGPDSRLEAGAWIDANGFIGRSAVVGAGSVVGLGATVLPEVKIGANCSIGAGSLVTRDIPDGSVAEGSPCRVTGDNGLSL